jgi:hypothetical protein
MDKELELEVARLAKMIARRYEFLAATDDLEIQRQHKSVIAELQAILDNPSSHFAPRQAN